ncbi:TPA: hypothetical protein ACF2YT_001643 [Providencia alcalifaciens]
MNLMSVSQYAKHSGMSRQALYNWEAKQGFPARVDGKIDQEACDKYLSRYRDSHDPRIKNSAPTVKRKSTRDNTLIKMSVSEIKQALAECGQSELHQNDDERAQLAAKAVGLYLSQGDYNPPITFGGYRLSLVETPEWELNIVAGGAFGLSADDVIYECREHVLSLMDDETEETAMREVNFPLLKMLAVVFSN